mgnify:CR=1 FL=1
MEKSKVDAIYMQYQDKIPQEQKLNFKRSLERADDSRYESLSMVKIHNPIVILILSIFLGGLGIDRFMLGDIGLGICKLLFGWITFGIWPLVDIYFAYKRAKELNVQNLLNALN